MKVRKCIGRSTTLMLYKSMVLPHFDYCDIVYMNASLYNLNKLQYTQNSACRIILLADKETRICDMHGDLNFEMLDTRRKIHLDVFNQRNVYPEISTTITRMYVPVTNVSRRQTRQRFINVFAYTISKKLCWSESHLLYRSHKLEPVTTGGKD